MNLQLAFSIFLFNFSSHLQAQDQSINLIPNPGFEDVNVCTKYGESCFPEGWRSTTLKAFYYLNSFEAKQSKHKAFEGDRFVSICMHDGKRDFDQGFLQTPLLCELEAGRMYELSFQYKVPFNMLEEFGVYFTDSLIVRKNNDALKNIEPNVVFKTTSLLPANKWIISKGVFKAKGGEQVIIIGNFNTNENSRITPLESQKKRKKKDYDNLRSRTYYLFDSFRLTPIDGEVDCDIEIRRKQIYDDNVRHGKPYKKVYPVSLDTVELEEVEIEPLKEIESEFLVIDSDSIVISETFELPNILFGSNSDQMLPIAYSSLRKLANYLQFNRNQKISITGHTDDIGNDYSNQSLSERRAKSVQDYLINQGISKSRISYEGKGESEPLVPNDTEEGKAKNRRVEFSLTKDL